jgi:hypothetical protein
MRYDASRTESEDGIRCDELSWWLVGNEGRGFRETDKRKRKESVGGVM